MARLQHIGASQDWFIGEDKTLAFEIYTSDEATIQDVSAFAMAFYLREVLESDRKVLTCTTGASTITVTGSHNADPDTNTQRTNVIVADTDTDHLRPGKYQYWLWRTDAGNETVLAHGTAELLPARQ
jgi:hypothetical protein